jgi:hypothetical protein
VEPPVRGGEDGGEMRKERGRGRRRRRRHHGCMSRGMHASSWRRADGAALRELLLEISLDLSETGPRKTFRNASFEKLHGFFLCRIMEIPCKLKLKYSQIVLKYKVGALLRRHASPVGTKKKLNSEYCSSGCLKAFVQLTFN